MILIHIVGDQNVSNLEYRERSILEMTVYFAFELDKKFEI